MSAKGILHRAVALQTPTTEPHLKSMAATWEPKSRKQTPKQALTYDIVNQWEAQL